MEFEFTKTEWEIIEHRLDCPSCLAEALEESGYSREEIIQATKNLLEGGRKTGELSPVETIVLQDAIEGSVFMGIASDVRVNRGEEPRVGELGWGKYLSYCKAAKGIEDKTGWYLPRR